jgi:PST family polysaccharide transporter
VFNGVVKYLSEYKDDKPKLQQLFSTTFVFMVVGTLLSSVVLFIFASPISNYLFTDSVDYSFVIRFVALAAPSIAVQRVFSGVVNGLSEYKKFAKIELISYLLSIALLVVCLYQYNLSGVLIAIALAPAIQVAVVAVIFYKLQIPAMLIILTTFRFFTSKAKDGEEINKTEGMTLFGMYIIYLALNYFML